MKKFRLLTLLALLMTVATGAWADEQSESFTTATSQMVTYTGEHFTITGQDVDAEGLWITASNMNQGGAPNTVTISSKNGEDITRIEAVIGYIEDWNCELASTSGNVTGTYANGQTITISFINATTVTLSCTQNDGSLLQFYSWIIYYGSAPAATTFAVDLKANTDDASNWTGKAGSATTFSALPLENVAVGDAVTLKYSGDRRVKTVTATLLQMQSLTVAKGYTKLSGDKVLYYLPGDTYRQALARTENQSTGGLGWGYWEDSSLTTIYFKEVSDKAWDVAIDGDSNFGSGKGSCPITFDTEIDPTGHTFQFVGSK